MIARLVRQDPAFRALPAWLLLGALNSAVIANVIAGVAVHRDLVIPYRAVAFGTWVSVALFLLVGAVRTRASEHALGLPLPGPRLWLAHVVAVASGALTIIAGTWLVLLTLTAQLHGRIPRGPGASGVALLLASGALLAVVLIESARRDLAVMALRGRLLAWRIAVLVGVGALVVALAPGPAGFAAVLFVAASVLALAAFRSVPGALLLQPLDTRAPRPGDDRVAAGAAALPGGRAARARLITLLYGWIPLWIRLSFLLFIALFGWIVGGGARLLDESGDMGGMRFFYVYLSVYMLLSAGPGMLRPLRFVDPLAVSRNRVFAALMLPIGLPFLVGACAGLALSGAPAREELPAVAAVLAAWQCVLAFFLRSYRAGLPNWVRQAAFWLPAVVLLGLPLAQLFSAIARRGPMFVGETAAAAWVADAASRPAGALLVTLAAVAGVAAACALAVHQFRRMEIPLRPVRYELIEACREDR